MENEMTIMDYVGTHSHPNASVNYQVSSILFGDIIVPNYRVRLYPAFGYSILYKEYSLTESNHKKITTQVESGREGGHQSHIKVVRCSLCQWRRRP